MWRRIFSLMIKEFLALLKDKRSRMVIAAPPVIQLVVFGYAATYDLNHVPYAVYNEDTGAVSRQIAARFEGSPTFHLTGYLDSESQIAPLLNNKRVLMVVHFGPHFSRDMLLNRPANLQIIVDGRDSNTASLVLGYARSIVISANQDWIETRGTKAAPAELNVRTWFNPNLESRWFVVPGIVGLLTLVVTMLVTALSVAREREAGTFDQLLVRRFIPV